MTAMSAIWTIEPDTQAWTEWAQRLEAAPASPFILNALAGHRTSRGGWALDLGCGTGRAFRVLNQQGY
jgi:hypothetical protein